MIYSEKSHLTSGGFLTATRSPVTLLSIHPTYYPYSYNYGYTLGNTRAEVVLCHSLQGGV